MKRADRLYALMTRLKDGGLHRAEDMARDLGVSLRTIYRDMEVLAASGVPVEGERGAGYTARASITLPPLNLTEPELEALHLGLAAVGASGMPELADPARALSRKIEAVLPEDTGQAARRFGFATYPFAEAALGFRHMPAFRAAIRARQKLRIVLADETKPHVVRPLHLDYWGRIWTCIVWDEEAGDFATFRIDRVETLTPLPGLFVDEPGKRLSDYRGSAAR
ncbi:helix-turn-helix transcriptional regulator [Roseivivax isoporae]|uniref:Transcriptional regulator n=1 Tax=Roseivivax isoporae LMG 25204 TaxID=1449351 RepID=X7F8B8_9RHOB|nr:YafY family protein [Roseivivax isoporae]ETX28334.1 transcriptional regulator [Roseivivax isoporae LMG 25204]